jgi:hypothetical protein
VSENKIVKKEKKKKKERKNLFIKNNFNRMVVRK